jgi:hypothetical protein
VRGSATIKRQIVKPLLESSEEEEEDDEHDEDADEEDADEEEEEEESSSESGSESSSSSGEESSDNEGSSGEDEKPAKKRSDLLFLTLNQSLSKQSAPLSETLKKRVDMRFCSERMASSPPVAELLAAVTAELPTHPLQMVELLSQDSRYEGMRPALESSRQYQTAKWAEEAITHAGWETLSAADGGRRARAEYTFADVDVLDTELVVTAPHSEQPSGATAEAPFWHHGRETLRRTDVHALRQFLRLRHAAVTDELEKWWQTALRSRHSSRSGIANDEQRISRREYVSLVCKMIKATLQVVGIDDDEDHLTEAEEVVGGFPGLHVETGMDSEGFKEVIFEFTDLWTKTTDPAEFVQFSRALFKSIARVEDLRQSEAHDKMHFWHQSRSDDGRRYVWKAAKDVVYAGHEFSAVEVALNNAVQHLDDPEWLERMGAQQQDREMRLRTLLDLDMETNDHGLHAALLRREVGVKIPQPSRAAQSCVQPRGTAPRPPTPSRETSPRDERTTNGSSGNGDALPRFSVTTKVVVAKPIPRVGTDQPPSYAPAFDSGQGVGDEAATDPDAAERDRTKIEADMNASCAMLEAPKSLVSTSPLRPNSEIAFIKHRPPPNNHGMLPSEQRQWGERPSSSHGHVHVGHRGSAAAASEGSLMRPNSAPHLFGNRRMAPVLGATNLSLIGQPCSTMAPSASVSCYSSRPGMVAHSLASERALAQFFHLRQDSNVPGMEVFRLAPPPSPRNMEMAMEMEMEMEMDRESAPEGRKLLTAQTGHLAPRQGLGAWTGSSGRSTPPPLPQPLASWEERKLAVFRAQTANVRRGLVAYRATLNKGGPKAARRELNLYIGGQSRVKSSSSASGLLNSSAGAKMADFKKSPPVHRQAPARRA